MRLMAFNAACESIGTLAQIEPCPCTVTVTPGWQRLSRPSDSISATFSPFFSANLDFEVVSSVYKKTGTHRGSLLSRRLGNLIYSQNRMALVYTLGILAVGIKLLAAWKDVYWSDEMISLEFARDPSWSSVFWDNSPPLFPLILKFWTRIFASDFAIKLLPVIFSSLTPWVLYRLAKNFYTERISAIVLLLASCHMMSLHYATEVRAYALCELLAALQLYYYFSICAYSDGRRRHLAGFVITSTGLLLTQYFSIVLIAAQTVVFIRRREFSPSIRRLLLVILIVLGFIGVGIYFYVLRRNNLAHLAAPDWKSTWLTPVELWLNLHSYSVIFAVTSAYAVMSQRNRLFGIDQVIFLCVFSSLAIALLTGLSATKDRYFIFLVPSIVLALSVFAANLRKPVFLLAAIALSALFVLATYRS